MVPVFQPRSPFRHRARTKSLASAPPVLGHRILSVVHGEESNLIVITLDGTVTDLIDAYEAFKIYFDDAWQHAASWDLDGGTVVVLQFESDHAGLATQWTAPDPETWVFEDGQPLDPPYAGSL